MSPSQLSSRKESSRKKYWILAACLLLLLLGGLFLWLSRNEDLAGGGPATSERPSAGTIQAIRLTARKHRSGPLFEKLLPEQTGLQFRVEVKEDHPLSRLYHSGFACGGIAIGDIDADGRPDIYLVNGPDKNRLFRQTSDLKFEDITVRAGVGGGEAWGAGAAMVDIDNDGDLDIYVCNYDEANLLYLNNGHGAFTEAASDFHLDIVDASLMPTFCDYDLDGDLDVYILTHRYYRAGGIPPRPPLMTRDGKVRVRPGFEKYYRLIKINGSSWTYEVTGRSDRLLRNNGDGTFTDVTAQAGINDIGEGLSATWWDYNQDGWPDLYVANDFHQPDLLYHNNRDGTFRPVTSDVIPHSSWFSMGSDAADLNNDGRVDLLVADMSATTHFKEKTRMGNMKTSSVAGYQPPQYMRNALYLNTGTGRMMEAAYLAGLASSDWTWTVKLADLDNDGRIDAFFTNGHVRVFNDNDHPFSIRDYVGHTQFELHKNAPPLQEQNLVFRNLGDLRFENVSRRWGLDDRGMSFAAAHADLDGDGDLDLVVANMDEPVAIYKNNSTDGHSVLVKLYGQQSNQFGIGAKIQIETRSGRQVRYLFPVSGFLTSNEPVVHFGLGRDETIESLQVDWPSGHRQIFSKLESDCLYRIAEPEGPPQPASPASKTPTMFVRSEVLRDVRHVEREFADFKLQPLLPSKLSQLGPGLAWGDVDGDGDDDLFVGGAAGQPGRLYLNQKGQFVSGDGTPFDRDAAAEDMAPLWLDADSDGDLDLYVASGGFESAPGDVILKDRLYLNDGHGSFSKAPTGTLPDVRDSTGVVVAADVDRDGDLDLFVGGRVIPGQYPLSPNSRLLRNDMTSSGKFTDVTDVLAPNLRTAGMVTSAVWSDADGDGWIDLLVTHEWGPVRLWRNNQGKLVDATEPAGLAKRTGWWNGIAARDIDNDGDIDYVVTNVGLNTKYQASFNRPASLYYGDFAGKGRRNLVEADYEGDTLFPIRGKSCSTRAMPHLRKKFTTFNSFALASLQDIYTPTCLDEAHRYEATELRSGILLNDGTGHFEFRALPRLAQISPGFGVVLTEVDGDGHADVYMVQNFFSPQQETGRMDGGLSLLLAGRGDGTFVPIWPDRSGLIVPGDAKSLVASDLNGDGWVDFVVGLNNDHVVAFENAGSQVNHILRVRLEGMPGNFRGVGARVTVRLNDDTRQTAEVQAGGGYLSQSSADLVFGLGASGKAKRIRVRWPDGTTTLTSPEQTGERIVIRRGDPN